MPTLNQYADKDGYYILARPSDAGNITYQLKPRGEQIVRKVGYQDGEEIGWQVISALKVPNFVYTGNEGTADDDISVDLDKEDIDQLTEEDAKQLLDELSSVPRVGDSQTEEMREILGLSFAPDTEQVTETIGRQIREQKIIYKRTPNITKETENIPNFLIRCDDKAESESQTADYFEIIIIAGLGDAGLGKEFEKSSIIINIGVAEDGGIVLYNARIDTNLTIKIITECQKLMADILPVVVSELESMGIDTGPPESLPAPKVTSMH